MPAINVCSRPLHPKCSATFSPMVSKAPSSNSCNLAVVCGAQMPLKNGGEGCGHQQQPHSDHDWQEIAFGIMIMLLIIILIIILIFITNALDWRLIPWNYQPPHRHPFARWTVIKIRSKRLVGRRVKWETLGSALKDQWRCFIYESQWDM